MGIILGYFSFLCLGLLLSKALTHKFHLTKMDKILWKMHKPACAVFLIVCTLHILFVYPVLKTRHRFLPITGILLIILAVLTIALCHVIKSRRWNLGVHRILSIGMLCCMIGHMTVYVVDYKTYQTRIHDIQIEDIHISGISDGSYTGEYDAGYIYAKVEVTVKDGQIEDIQLLRHENERGTLAEKITDEIMTKQQIDVDAVSGATNSSLVIKKAIENALKGHEVPNSGKAKK